MNIRDVETETGLTRANIRYYEKEGLLLPVRQENGYRDYTKENVETLKRIKLLRKLGVSIEEIIQLQRDEESLAHVLTMRIHKAQMEERKLQEQQRICVMMQDDGVTYHSLHADLYLCRFGESGNNQIRRNDPVEMDQEYQYPYSWRRFFARQIDIMFYALIFNAICYLGFRIMPVQERWFSILSTFVSTVFMYMLEPIFLHLFATTPGKALLGIRVYNVDGSKLTREEARERVGNLLIYGLGLNIPIISLFRLWKSYRMNQDGESLPWDEYYSSVEIESPRIRHKIAGLAAVGLTYVITFGLIINAMYPIHRGHLTKAELAANYNRYAGSDARMNLDDDCKWKEVSPYESYGIYLGAQMPDPELEIVEKDGFVTGISFSVDTNEGTGHGYQSLIKNLMWAYGGAQRGMSLSEMEEMIALIDKYPPMNFSAEIGNIQLEYAVSYIGYNPLHLQGNVSVRFRMNIIDQ